MTVLVTNLLVRSRGLDDSYKYERELGIFVCFLWGNTLDALERWKGRSERLFGYEYTRRGGGESYEKGS